MTINEAHDVRSSPLTRRLGCGFLAAITLLAILGAPSGDPARADSEPPNTPDSILLYTDNTPGSIIWAGAFKQALLTDDSVTVVITQEDFIAALPTKNWDFVLAVSRYTDATPDYVDSLRPFLDQGGQAEIIRWRDDPESPVPDGLVVMAPSALQFWQRGRTALAYTDCKGYGSSTAVVGYALGKFEGLTPDPIQTIANSGFQALVASTTMMAAPTTSQQCRDKYAEEIDRARDVLTNDELCCFDAYSPCASCEPPRVGDLDKYADCLVDAATTFQDSMAAAKRHYKVCMDKANPQ